LPHLFDPDEYATLELLSYLSESKIVMEINPKPLHMKGVYGYQREGAIRRKLEFEEGI
jgi:hypothetical protein